MYNYPRKISVLIFLISIGAEFAAGVLARQHQRVISHDLRKNIDSVPGQSDIPFQEIPCVLTPCNKEKIEKNQTASSFFFLYLPN